MVTGRDMLLIKRSEKWEVCILYAIRNYEVSNKQDEINKLHLSRPVNRI